MTYTKQATELLQNRNWTSCAGIRTPTHGNIVVIAGGSSAGTEIWNPLDGSIELVFKDFPEVCDIGNGHAKLVPINDNYEALLYGGFYGPWPGGNNTQKIWKFSGFDFAWSEFGDMLSPRDDHVVIPVDGVQCPG